MHIITSGKPTKVPLSLCRNAIRYFGEQLLTSRMNDSITVHLTFSNKNMGTGKAVGFLLDRKTFIIQIRTDHGLRMMLLSLAHEMVHVKQWATGELVDYVHNKTVCKWKGKTYSTSEDDEDYWLHSPWEIDAYGRELGLYKMFKEEPQYVRYRRRKH